MFMRDFVQGIKFKRGTEGTEKDKDENMGNIGYKTIYRFRVQGAEESGGCGG